MTHRIFILENKRRLPFQKFYCNISFMFPEEIVKEKRIGLMTAKFSEDLSCVRECVSRGWMGAVSSIPCHSKKKKR